MTDKPMMVRKYTFGRVGDHLLSAYLCFLIAGWNWGWFPDSYPWEPWFWVGLGGVGVVLAALCFAARLMRM